MPLPLKRLDQITEADLVALVTGGEAESKVLDYKELLPGNADSDKKEFLYDVSSFANAAGGHLLYGVKARDGRPTELNGIQNLNADSEKLRLHNIIQSGIQPRIPGIVLQDIPLGAGKSVLGLCVPRSWNSPHMVTFQGASKFYSRNSAGKYPLDVSEIRSAFLASETINERIRSFRSERLAKIISKETSTTVSSSSCLVFHILPLVSFSPGFSIDLAAVTTLTRSLGGTRDGGNPMHTLGYYPERFSFDGIVFSDSRNESETSTYSEIFRNGCVEIVDCYSTRQYNGENVIMPLMYEWHLISYARLIFRLLKGISVEPPFVVGLSLLNVRGYGIHLDRFEYGLRVTQRARVINRDNLIMPEVVMNDYGETCPSVFKDLFDPIWNACGHQGSFNYDETGQWKFS